MSNVVKHDQRSNSIVDLKNYHNICVRKMRNRRFIDQQDKGLIFFVVFVNPANESDSRSRRNSIIQKKESFFLLLAHSLALSTVDFRSSHMKLFSMMTILLVFSFFSIKQIIASYVYNTAPTRMQQYD
jgi:hypothetical protein